MDEHDLPGLSLDVIDVALPGLTLRVRALADLNQYRPDPEAEAVGVSDAQWPLFGVVWPASRVLAHRLALRPAEDLAGRHILEMGCGLGLPSLVLAARGLGVLATDVHPRCGDFLAHNAALNALPPVPFVRRGWTEPDDPPLGTFDLLLASDVLYEPDHVDQLAGFVARHAAERAEVWVVDAGRGNHQRFTRALTAQGFTMSRVRPTDLEPSLTKGWELTYARG